MLEVARALRFHSGLDLKHWGDCVLAAVYIINRLPSTVLQFKTPHELIYHEAPDYNILKAFGCLAFASNHKPSTDKFAPRGIPCVFIGYPAHNKGYKLLDLTTMETFITRDVVFHEHVFPFLDTSLQKYLNPVPASVTPPNTYFDDEILPETIPENHPVPPVTSPTHQQTASHTPSFTDAPSEQTDTAEKSLPLSPAIRKSTRQSKPPAWLDNYVNPLDKSSANIVAVTTQPIPHHFHCFLASIAKVADPASFKEAVKHQHWVSAINTELEALESNNTWQVTSLPPNKQAIGCKCLF